MFPDMIMHGMPINQIYWKQKDSWMDGWLARDSNKCGIYFCPILMWLFLSSFWPHNICAALQLCVK